MYAVEMATSNQLLIRFVLDQGFLVYPNDAFCALNARFERGTNLANVYIQLYNIPAQSPPLFSRRVL